jgi:hypothetical protein
MLHAKTTLEVAQSREIVLRPRRRGGGRPALVGSPASATLTPHRKTRRERTVAAAVALRQVAGGLRRALTVTAAVALASGAALLLAFPRVMSVVLAVGAGWLALVLTWHGVRRRRRRDDLHDV